MEIVLILYIVSVIFTIGVWSYLTHIDYENGRYYSGQEFLEMLLICFIPVINLISALWGINALRKGI